jgi:hypothetical protein
VTFDDDGADSEVAEVFAEDTLSQTRRGLKVPTPQRFRLNFTTPFPIPAHRSICAHKDLRQLSQWIRAKRQVSELNKDDDET